MKKLLKEFKEFISRGNVMDLAVGMIIGGAFTAIVTALVNNILNPLLTCIGVGETRALITTLKPAVVDAEGVIVHEAVVINWGSVISAVITFLLTALVLFVIIKVINRAQQTALKTVTKIKSKKEKGKVVEETVVEEVVVAPKLTTEDLLQQILDVLNKDNKKEEKGVKEEVTIE